MALYDSRLCVIFSSSLQRLDSQLGCVVLCFCDPPWIQQQRHLKEQVWFERFVAHSFWIKPLLALGFLRTPTSSSRHVKDIRTRWVEDVIQPVEKWSKDLVWWYEGVYIIISWANLPSVCLRTMLNCRDTVFHLLIKGYCKYCATCSLEESGVAGIGAKSSLQICVLSECIRCDPDDQWELVV